MLRKIPLWQIVLYAAITASPAIAEAASVEELWLRCQEAREKNLAPLRQAAIAECASRHRGSRTREDCERLYSDLGGGGGTVEGGFRPGMFYDLPECVEYFEAQDRQSGSRSRR